ncbi:CRISPR-associated endonuclease Cas1 [Methanococcoides sp. FTZ1]|uniref:CRISPR-associated endonuclease Cas1 n=1 Tax=Methanococcoides sp. FTZ1 TaxID=3439061 RepID=UPI003F84D79F
MKMLLLNGHGINMRVDAAKLHIKDGRFSTTEEPQKYVFYPKRIDIDSIVVYGRSGSLSFEAIRWLIKHNVQITILNWDGKLLTTMLLPESTNVKTKFAQYHAYEDKNMRIEFAKKFIEAKFSKSEAVLDYLKQRYPEIEYDFTDDKARLEKAKSIREILGVEGGVAWKYWNEYAKAIPEEYDFRSRINQYRRATGAGDKVNVMLNYGYALLESECLRAINSVGLDAHVGFLHEMNQSKYSLAYDLQEPFRFIVDLAVMSLIEKGAMDNKDFVRTESFSLRLRPTGARKVTEEFNSVINRKVEYRKKNSSWGSVLLLKARELSHHLVVKRKAVEFNKPVYVGKRDDTDLLRQKIVDMSYTDWKKMGFSKGTLHYMKQNAKSDKPFTLNAHVRERLEGWADANRLR